MDHARGSADRSLSKRHRCKLLSLNRIFCSIVLTAAVAAPAAAQQMYAWRDANGGIVISNVRQPDGSPAAKTYAVSNSTAIRTTRYVPPTRGQMYDSLIS